MNKAKHVLAQNELNEQSKKVKLTKDLIDKCSILSGVKYFSEDGS